MTLMERRRALMGQMREIDPWPALFASIDAGTYASDYALGDILPIHLGAITLDMEIIGFDKDADSTTETTVPITMLSKNVYPVQRRLNPSKVSGTIGTGTIGGFANSEIRQFLVETVYPLIPQSLRNRMKTVKKYTRAYNVDDAIVQNMLSNEYIWVPSRREIGLTGYNENTGAYYGGYFSSNARRIRTDASGNVVSYMIRSARTNNTVIKAGDNGASQGTTTEVSALMYFPVGICVGGETV